MRKLFALIPDEQSQQVVRSSWENHLRSDLHPIKLQVPITRGNENSRKGRWSKHCQYKEWVSYFLGSWGINRSAEQTSENRFAVHAICLSRAPIHSSWTQNKRHQFLNWTQMVCVGKIRVINTFAQENQRTHTIPLLKHGYWLGVCDSWFHLY